MKKLQKFTEYRISYQDIASLDRMTRSTLIISSFAANETSTLMRLHIGSAHPLEGSELHDYLNLSQRMLLLRRWSASLFEYLKFFGKLFHSTKKSHELYDLIVDFKMRLEILKSGDGFILAEKFRNKSTNHYDHNAAEQFFKDMPEDENFTAFLHKLQGNSSFALGDAVMSFGLILNQAGGVNQKEKAQELFDSWAEWLLSAQRWLSDFHLEVFKIALFDRIPDRKGTERIFWFEPNWISEGKSPNIPLIIGE